jgi:hypothetical protein
MNVIVFKFKISLRRCDCDYWSRDQKKKKGYTTAAESVVLAAPKWQEFTALSSYNKCQHIS